MPESSTRVTIVVALITLVGTLGAAALSNWDKIFPPNAEPPANPPLSTPGPTPVPTTAVTPTGVSPATPVKPPSATPPPAPAVNAPVAAPSKPSTDPMPVATTPAPTATGTLPPAIINLTGIWQDTGNPTILAQVSQQGREFQFQRGGMLPNGLRFDSQGNGVVSGQQVRLRFATRYATGDQSNGECEGLVNPSGDTLSVQCRDSLSGLFQSVSVRR